MQIKNAPVALTKVVMNITSEAKHDTVPLWRVRTIVAKVLLITREIYKEAGDEAMMDSAWREHVEDHLQALLNNTCNLEDVLSGL